MDGQILPGGADTPFSTAEPQAVQPVADQGVAAQAPPALETPGSPPQAGSFAQPAPQVPAQPQVDPAVYEQTTAKLKQYEQAFNELRQLQQLAQQQAQEQAIAHQTQSRIDQAYQLAENMEPAQAFSYIRRIEDQERANYQAMMRQIQQQAQQQTYRAVATVAAPLYAQQLARQHGLPAEYADRLAMLSDPHQMDAYLPVMKREHENNENQKRQYQELLQRFDQMQRSQGAAEMDASGVSNVSSTTGLPVVPNSNDGFTPGSRQQLAARLAPLLGLQG